VRTPTWPIPTVAWTGGDFQYGPQDIPHARALYRWHLRTYLNYWGEFPHPEIRDRFKSWSRADSYATRRDQQ